MSNRDQFLEQLTQEDLDRLLAGMEPQDFALDDEVKDRIQAKVKQRMGESLSGQSLPNRIAAADQIQRDIKISAGDQQRKPGRTRTLRRIAAALAVIGTLTLLSPQVQATVRRLVSLVPGIGMVESRHELLTASDVRILSGESQILRRPVLLSDGQHIQMTVQIKSAGGPKTDQSLDLGKFQALLNGEPVTTRPVGSASGSDRETVFQVFFETAAKAGDQVRFNHPGLGLSVEGTLRSLSAQDPSDLPHARLGDILVMADPVAAEQGWEVYLYALSDVVKPLSFTESLDFDGEVSFLSDNGKTYPLVLPASYGTGFMPPLTLDAPAGKGKLVIPSLSWTTQDTSKVKIQIPQPGEVIQPDTSFLFAGVPIRIQEIRRSPIAPNEVRVAMSWPETAELDWFFMDGSHSMTVENGVLSLSFDPGLGLTNHRTITLRSPQFTRKQPLRIPLELKR